MRITLLSPQKRLQKTLLKESRAAWYLNLPAQAMYTECTVHPKYCRCIVLNLEILICWRLSACDPALWTALRKNIVLPENKLGCRLPVTLLFQAPLLFPSPKQQQWSKGHHSGMTVPSDLFLGDNMFSKHVHFTPNNHIYQVFQSSSCWQWCDFWLWLLREFRRGKKIVYFSQLVSSGQCFHGVSFKAIPGALEIWTYWIQWQKF